MFAVCCMQSTAWCSLFVVRCLSLFVVRCSLRVVCSLFVVRCVVAVCRVLWFVVRCYMSLCVVVCVLFVDVRC